jgi:GTPase Era involved in 16S rRNA processing
VSSDPPLTETEVTFLQQVKERVPKLFFVFNKIDYLNEEEQQTAHTFLRDILCERMNHDATIPIFPVSARMGLDGKISRDASLWHRSGMQQLERHLVEFLAREKSFALTEAIRHKALDILENSLMYLRLELRSIEISEAELDARLRTFEVELERTRRERLIAQDLLIGDRKRTAERIEEQAAHMRKHAVSVLNEAVRLSGALSEPGHVNQQLAQEALASAIPELFSKKLDALQRYLQDWLSEVLKPHQQRLDELIEQVRKTASDIFEIPYHALEP